MCLQSERLATGVSEHLIQPTLNKNDTRLKNSHSFVEKAKTWNISNDEVQVSYDIVNLYPSVPTKEATTIIIDMLARDNDLKSRTKLDINEIRQMINLCLATCYFIWENEIYEQENSGPIGLALMVVIAEAFLQHPS